MGAKSRMSVEIIERSSDPRVAGSIKSAVRVLEILEFFSEVRRSATVGEVCRSLSYPQSSTSALLHSMQDLGYLTFLPEQRSFAPTVRVALLGGWLNEALFPNGSITQIMEMLRERTGETIILALQNGVHAQYASILLGTSPKRVYIRTGSLKPICRAAVGKVLLTHKAPRELGRLVRRINAEAADPADMVDLTALSEELLQIRRNRHARSLGSVRAKRDVIATSLPMPAGQPPLAIGVGGPLERMNEIRDDVLRAFDEVIGIGRP